MLHIQVIHRCRYRLNVSYVVDNLGNVQFEMSSLDNLSTIKIE